MKNNIRNSYLSCINRAAQRLSSCKKLLAYVLIAVLLAVFTGSLVYALGERSVVKVESFGDYPSSVQVAFGTSYSSVIAVLPASIPAKGESFDKKVSVSWESSPAYEGVAGVYLFTAVSQVETSESLPDYTVIINESVSVPALTGEYEISAPPGTPLAALGLPANIIAAPQAQPAMIDVPVNWICEDYNENLPGDYIFSADFTNDGFIFEGTMPQVIVTILDEEPPQSDGYNLTFNFDGLLEINRAEHAMFASYGIEEQRQVFLADVRVIDESGNEIPDVSVDFGGFDISAEDYAVFTVEYSAYHPLTAELFTAVREVRLTSADKIIITAFDLYPIIGTNHLPADTIFVRAGTEEADLPFPGQIKATAGDGEQNGLILPVSAWNCSAVQEYDPGDGEEAEVIRGYDPDIPGVYIFTPVLDLPEDMIIAEGLSLPAVYVVVEGEDMMMAMDLGVSSIITGDCSPDTAPGTISWTFDSVSGILTISGIGPMDDFVDDAPWHSHKMPDGQHYHICPLVKTIVVGEGITTIGANAFPVFNTLTSVSLPSTLQSIGSLAFREATALTSISIPLSVTSIGRGAFADNSNLVSINIPEGITVIENDTFRSCNKLSAIVFPSTLTAIGQAAFDSCHKLLSVTFHNPNPPSSNGAFSGLPEQNPKGNLYFPETAVRADWVEWAKRTEGIKFWLLDTVAGGDKTAPTLADGAAPRESETTARVSFFSNEEGEYYYLALLDGANAPSKDAIVSGGTAGGRAIAGRTEFPLENLSAKDVRDIYIVVKDAAGNVSELLKIDLDDYLTRVSVVSAPGVPAGSSFTDGGQTTSGGDWVIGSEHVLTANPPSGYHFVKWTVTGEGSVIDNTVSPSARLKVGTGNTVVAADFATNLAQLNIRKDGFAYTGYTDKFYLSKDGVNFYSSIANIGSFATVHFSDLPAGSYTVYTAPRAEGAIPVFLNMAQDGISSPAQVNYYTLTVQTRPQSAGTVSPNGVFLAGSSVPVSAVSSEESVFKRWTTSQPGGKFGDTGGAYSESADTTYIVDGTVLLTAYYMQSDGAGLTVTSPDQTIRRRDDTQVINAAFFAQLDPSDPDPAVSVTSLQWFRESVNQPTENIESAADFGSGYVMAALDNKGEIYDQASPGNILSTARIKADKNGRYWVKATLSSGGASITKIACADIKNVFTGFEVLLRHWVSKDTMIDYAPMVNEVGLEPGIPYDLDGEASGEVVETLPAGLSYDKVDIAAADSVYNIDSYSYQAPGFPAVPAADERGSLVLNAAFLANTVSDSNPPETGVRDRHRYTVNYQLKLSLVAVRAFRVNIEGDRIKSEGPMALLGNNYQDFRVPRDSSDPNQAEYLTVTNFAGGDGVLIPRPVYQLTGDDPPRSTTQPPVGWYIATEPVDWLHEVDGFKSDTPNTYNGIVYTPMSDWEGFNPGTLTLDSSPQPDTNADEWENYYKAGDPYAPLADGDKLFFVYYDDGAMRVWEEYRLFKRDDEAGYGQTGDVIKLATYKMLVPDSTYTYKSSANLFSGYVPVGYRVIRATDWDTENSKLNFNLAKDSADLVGFADEQDNILSGGFHFLLPEDPMAKMHNVIDISVEADDFAAEYGNYAHIVYYYAVDANGNGLPDQGEYPVTVDWVGVYADGTEIKLQDSRILRDARIDLPNHATPTRVYVGLDGRGYWTDDGTITLSTNEVINTAAAGWENGEYFPALAKRSADAGGYWIFRGDGAGNKRMVPIDMPDVTGQSQAIIFYYDFSSDGVEADKNQHVTVKYRGVNGADLHSFAEVYMPDKAAYTVSGMPLEIPGYVAVGYITHNFDGVAATDADTSGALAEQLFDAGIHSFYVEGTAITLPSGDNRRLTYIYLKEDGDADGDGLANNTSVLYGDGDNKGGGALIKDSDEDGLPDKWEVENGLNPNDDGSGNIDNGPDGDPDGDGLSNYEEYTGKDGNSDTEDGTDPHDPDTDGDMLPDGWEVENDLEPTDNGSGNIDNGADGDPDGDGLSNYEEYTGKDGNPDTGDGTDPQESDTDGDTLPDGWEVDNDLNPNDDGSGKINNGPAGDPDGDKWTNLEELNGKTDPQIPETRTLIYNANGGRNAPAAVRLPQQGGYDTILSPPGNMEREGYAFKGWNTHADGTGIGYSAGDSFSLAARIDGKLYNGIGSDGSNITMYAMWSIAPVVSLNPPFISEDGSTVTLTAGVKRTQYNYDVVLKYREAGGEWQTVYTDSDVTLSSTDISETLTGPAIKKDTLYEVLITAWNSNQDGQEATKSRNFLIPSASGGGEIKGEVKNGDKNIPPGVIPEVIVSLMVGNITIQSETLTNITTIMPQYYSFINVSDGWYSVVAFDGEYTVTRSVRMEGGEMVDMPEPIVFGVGKTQSIVEVNEGSPVVTAEHLPELFADGSPVYTEDDKTFVNIGGMIEMRLEASEIPGNSAVREDLDEAAAINTHRLIQYVDLAVYKTLYDTNGSMQNNTQLTELPVLLRITVPAMGGNISAVYRLHDGQVDSPLPKKNSYEPGEEEFFIQEEDVAVLYVKSFSGYALAVDAYSVTASAGAGGSVSPAIQARLAGETVTVTADPHTGYSFGGWAATGITLPDTLQETVTFTMPARNVTLTAQFIDDTPPPPGAEQEISYIIEASAGSGGTISPDKAVWVNQGDAQTFKFIPDSGYRVREVLVDGLSIGAPGEYRFINIVSDHTIFVGFEPVPAPPGSPGLTEPLPENTYTVNTTTEIGGEVSSSGTTTVYEGDKLTIEFTPESGYHVADILIDGVSVGAAESYTFDSVEGNHEVRVVFAPNNKPNDIGPYEGGGDISAPGVSEGNPPMTGTRNDLFVWMFILLEAAVGVLCVYWLKRGTRRLMDREKHNAR